MKINKEETEIIINGKIHKFADIELIYTKEDNCLVICKSNGIIKELNKNAIRNFKEIAVQFILQQNEDFVLLLTGNNIVNLNAIKTIAYDTMDMTITTKNYTYTLNNVSGVEYILLRDKFNKLKEKQELSK